MSASLCIDWGNSLVKAGVFVNGNLEETFTFKHSEALTGVTSVIQKHAPKRAIICSVSADSYNMEQMLNELLEDCMKLDNSTSVPIMNAYTSPDSLGADRLALAVAAHMLYPGQNNLVVSLGTCITYNFVQKNKAFRGGAISPGLDMRFKAMNQFTDRLPLVDMNGEVLLLGYDTETCIRSGAVFGMAAEIDGIVNEYSSQYPDFNAILTGGSSAEFASKLKCKIFADPDLLMKGLNLILKHNVPQLY